MPSESFISVHVTPKSGRDEVVGLDCGSGACACSGAGGKQPPEVRVRVTAPPDKGKANKAVCKVIADSLGIPKSAVRVTAGETSHHKRLGVDASAELVSSWMTSLPRI